MKNATITIKVTGIKEVDKAVRMLEKAREEMQNAVRNAQYTLSIYGVKVECDVELGKEPPADSAN